MSPRRVVVAGYGMAAARLAELVRAADPAGERVALTVVGAEPRPAYNRVLLSGVLAGTLTPADIALHDRGWAERNRVGVRLGVPVTGLDRRGRRVRLADGTSLGYDDLVLATGGRPWLPPVEGLSDGRGGPAEGVATLRDLADCLRIRELARPGAPVAVLGGGVLGVETALGLAAAGARVTLIHPAAHLMERHLDRTAGMILARLCRAAGVRTAIGAAAVRHDPGEGVKLDDGSVVPAALTVVTAGTRPETALAARAGLAADGGIAVDDRLRTADPRVRALGDCARAGTPPQGLLRPAWEQAAVLAGLLTGTAPDARYHAGAPVTRLRAGGVDLTAFGETRLETDSADAEVISYADPARGMYAKVALDGDRVIGAIALGLPDAAAALVQLHDDGAPTPADRPGLLLGRALPPAAGPGPDSLPGTALVCRCNSVTKAALLRAVRETGGDVAALARATRATTGCGDCLPAVRRLAARRHETEGTPA
ncbi:FAD-dependent oxidoreductase [Bailinhaonella thermotolerans]|uniref:NAD(P)/FAD-dependent oxidoreductase n=1 Tax=Bailinhaonella thermotolerans TaxID=1070861 RepID=A0A3A4AW30_9ACTN|nr:FAD-dependent oxidoreductase [Bailinhaonella thermotolerans]RJL34085.1 NAD(P)/FAD-dependent oxidoreductase [Bailinhaonella thermotolerans]